MASLEIDSVSPQFCDIFLRPPIINFVWCESGIAYVTFLSLRVAHLAIDRFFLILQLLSLTCTVQLIHILLCYFLLGKARSVVATDCPTTETMGIIPNARWV